LCYYHHFENPIRKIGLRFAGVAAKGNGDCSAHLASVSLDASLEISIISVYGLSLSLDLIN
jgi:hypothetical protein